MKGALKLGSVAGIKIELHWTFTLLIAWVVFLDLQQGGDLESSLFNVSLILILFICVVLHELGHALTAKKFKIQTQRITLLPIGGVAMLDKMPDKPKQELLVALAGPAVNVVIASLLLIFIPIKSYLVLEPEEIEQFLNTTGSQSFLFYLFVANIMLVVFNSIPAFPMDGGRVLRALLAMTMDRVKATNIAARIGQVFAVIFFILGLFFNPFLILIALFIFIGAYGENQMVRQTALLEGHKVKEAMLTNITLLKPENIVQEVIDILLSGTEKNFIVADNHEIVGILYHKDILNNSKNRSLEVKEIMQKEFKTIEDSGELKDIFDLITKEKCNFFAVTHNGDIVGAVDVSNIGEFILLKNNLIKK
ncbi:MAG: site-2 protease family protein [Flavobacteriaceae bacterium]|nr:site-2 protease family protein [Flavobacteriaceae bacterium]